MSTFDNYSAYYDLLYKEKDYTAEAAYVLSLIKQAHPGAKSVLDLGCGTGRHALLFHEAGYDVCGMDASDKMLERARQLAPDIPFHLDDARTFRLDRKFDVVTSLFHVASYQTTNRDFSDYLETARAHLAPGGIFIFDFWYGPGVLSDPPAVRAKRLEDETLKVLRLAEPTLDTLKNLVDVRYELIIEDRDGVRQTLVENHLMRYFFAPEIEHFLACNAMALQKIQAWMAAGPPTVKDWNACVIAGLA